LQLFFMQYPKYAHLKFFIFGESYAGHYVPALSAKIVVENANASNIYIDCRGPR